MGLLPDQLFNLTLPEFTDMIQAKLYFRELDGDTEMQRTAWQTSLLMSATGNYGKKGVDAKKLYKPRFDELGKLIETVEVHGAFTPIDKKDKDKKLNELMAKFNK